MAASGVRSSCETLATKSRRTRSSRSMPVISCRIASAPRCGGTAKGEACASKTAESPPENCKPAGGRRACCHHFGNQAEEGRVPHYSQLAAYRELPDDFSPSVFSRAWLANCTRIWWSTASTPSRMLLQNGVEPVRFVAQPFHEFVDSSGHAPQRLIQRPRGVVLARQRRFGLRGSRAAYL